MNGVSLYMTALIVKKTRRGISSAISESGYLVVLLLSVGQNRYKGRWCMNKLLFTESFSGRGIC